MPPRVSREEWDRRAATAGIEWVGDEPVRAVRKHGARCLTCGHEWRVTPDTIRAGHGCPACARQRVVGRSTGAQITREEWDRRATAVAIEWKGGDPVLTTRKHPARCLRCGHEWSAAPGAVARGKGCPKCAATTRRTPRAEWNRRAMVVGIEWLADPPNNWTPTPARCLTCSHEWSPRAGNVQQGQGCPRCAGQVVTPQEYHESAASLGVEWLEEPTSGSRKTSARCLSCGREWMTTPKAVRGGAGCDPCRRRAGNLTRRVSGEVWRKRAGTVGIEWIEEPTSSGVPSLARCLTCAHEWHTVPDSIKQGHGCPRCAGMIVTSDEWDSRAEVRGFRWLAPVRSTSEPVPAECLTCSYEWSPWPGDRKGCPRCAGKVITPEQWSTRAAAVGIEWLGGEPIRSSRKHAARCLTCGREWEVSPEKVQQGQGCVACGRGGFDALAPARVYLLTLDGALAKVGVTGDLTTRDRVAIHEARGWQVVAVWHLPSGTEALRVERAVLDQWRAQGLTFARPDEVPGGDGASECVHGADVPATVDYVNALLADPLDGRP